MLEEGLPVPAAFANRAWPFNVEFLIAGVIDSRANCHRRRSGCWRRGCRCRRTTTC